jgi:SAM-dependent methyltransferase
MLQDRLKWNEKYQTQSYPDEPAAIVKKYAKLAKGKKALDIAAGNGRNALLLAHQGFRVDAVDISDAGLNLFAAKHPNIDPICADLDDFDIPAIMRGSLRAGYSSFKHCWTHPIRVVIRLSVGIICYVKTSFCIRFYLYESYTIKNLKKKRREKPPIWHL